MARTYHISVPDNFVQCVERIKSENKYGIISQLFQKAIKDFDKEDYSLEKVEKEIKELNEQIKFARERIQFLDGIRQKLLGQAEENNLINISEEVEASEEPDLEKETRKKKRQINLWAQIIESKYKVEPDLINKMATEYQLYIENCQVNETPPLKIQEYLKCKEITPKPPRKNMMGVQSDAN